MVGQIGCVSAEKWTQELEAAMECFLLNKRALIVR